MSDVVGKLWGFCNTLRHDGINYGDYIEQLTYLLFLKLADEKGVPIPSGCDWKTLRAKSGTELLDYYTEILRTLSREKGILGDIFAGSLSKFREPVNLKKLIGLIDETEWTVLDVDLKANAYEGLLQKYAAEQKGAGQYFTPEQEKWLELIRAHLIENLVVDEADFRLIPFSRHGGWNKANKVFDGKLKEMLEEINVRMTS